MGRGSPSRLVENPYNSPQKQSRMALTVAMPLLGHHHAGMENVHEYYNSHGSSTRQSLGQRLSMDSTREEPRLDRLPPIHTLVPNLPSRTSPDESPRGALQPAATSPVAQSGVTDPTSPEYAYTLSQGRKRRRPSMEDAREWDRPAQVPRIHASPTHVAQRRPSPPAALPPTRPAPAPRSFSSQADSSAYYVAAPTRSEPRESMPPRIYEKHVETRSVERRASEDYFQQEAAPTPESRRGSEDYFYRQDHYREESRQAYPPSYRTAPPPPPPARTPYREEPTPSPSYPIQEPPRAYQAPSSYYSPQYPSHSQSLSTGSLPPGSYSQTPFTPGSYPRQSTYQRQVNYGPAGEVKQRKRRGNLPKEVTDKLRAWFTGHLHHPYPTEDEKQELMRDTGLHMNQISNWFINARRRQLPGILKDAEVEEAAMRGGKGSGRSSRSPVMQTTEEYGPYNPPSGRRYDSRDRRETTHLSDGEVSGTSSHYDPLERQRPLNRGSI